MSKFVFEFVVVCLAASCVADQQNLQTFVNNGLTVPGLNLTLAPNGDITGIQEAFDHGIAISALNNQPFYLGLLSLPFNQLCNLTGELASATCNLCNEDCTIAHNKYGGNCGPNPHPGKAGEQTCICNDNRPANLTVPTVDQVCGPLTPKLASVNITQTAINEVLKVREVLLQCNALPLLSFLLNLPYDNTGCISDCSTNHQYNNGTCEVTYAVPLTPDQTPTSNPKGLFCNCRY